MNKTFLSDSKSFRSSGARNQGQRPGISYLTPIGKNLDPSQLHYLCANLKSHRILVSPRSPVLTAWSIAPLSLQGCYEGQRR